MTSVVDDIHSRYVQGGLTEVYPDRIGWWDRYNFPTDVTDFEFTIPIKYHMRPDLLAFDLYGRSDYWYIVLQYNNIVDLTEEFVAGKQLILPSQHRVMMNMLNNKPGGVEV